MSIDLPGEFPRQAREELAVQGYFNALEGIAMEHPKALERAIDKLSRTQVMEHEVIVGGLEIIKSSIEREEPVDHEELDLTFSSLVRSFVFSGLYAGAPRSRNTVQVTSAVLGKDSKWMRKQLDIPARSIEALGYAPARQGGTSVQRAQRALPELAPRRGNYRRRLMKFGKEMLHGWSMADPVVVAARLSKNKKPKA